MKKLFFLVATIFYITTICGQTNKIESKGDVGIGETNPRSKLHVKSELTEESSVSQTGSNLLIEGTGTSRETNKGAALGFVVPADTDGSNPWEQGRILVTPGTTSNRDATGQMFIQTRYLNGSSWDWRNNLVLKSNGAVGVGETKPKSKLHVKSELTEESSVSQTGSNLLIEGTGTSRETNKGAALGFVVPADTDGSNPWEQGRILVTPGTTSNRNATGQMFIQTRYLNGSSWDWRNNLVLKSNGAVGVGETKPKSKLHVKSELTEESSVSQTGSNLLIEGTGTSRETNKGAALGFVVPADTDGSNPWEQGRILVTPGTTSNRNATGQMFIQTRYLNGSSWDWRNNLVLKSNGSVGVGKLTPDAKLDVAGNIKAHEIEVTLASMDDLNLNGTLAANNITLAANGQTADFVFADDYNLKPLSEVETFIKTNKHLPEIPSAAQMEKQGVNLAEMNKLLLQKVEELTLYQIEKDKEVQELKEARRKEQGERRRLKEKSEELEEALGKEQRARNEMEERLERLEKLLLEE